MRTWVYAKVAKFGALTYVGSIREIYNSQRDDPLVYRVRVISSVIPRQRGHNLSAITLNRGLGRPARASTS